MTLSGQSASSAGITSSVRAGKRALRTWQCVCLIVMHLSFDDKVRTHQVHAQKQSAHVAHVLFARLVCRREGRRTLVGVARIQHVRLRVDACGTGTGTGTANARLGPQALEPTRLRAHGFATDRASARAGICCAMMSLASSFSSASIATLNAVAIRLMSTLTKGETYCTSALERTSS